MKIYVTAADVRINQTLEMYDYCLSKYWPSADMTVLGYKQPQYKPQLVKFVSLGKDLGPHYLNKQLYEYFSFLEEPRFIFTCDDHPILQPVNNEVINTAEELLKKDSTIGRIGLTPDNATRDHTKIVSPVDEIELIESTNKNGHTYKLSAVWSAWNREYFLLYLNDYKNLWEWEIQGSARSNYDNFKVLGYIPSPLLFSHLIKGGKFLPYWHKEAVNKEIEMSPEDQQKLKGIYKDEIG